MMEETKQMFIRMFADTIAAENITADEAIVFMREGMKAVGIERQTTNFEMNLEEK